MEHFPDAEGLIIMDTGLFGTFQIIIVAAFCPLPGILLVVKPDGTYGPCWISCLARFGAGSILAQQAVYSLFVNV